MGALHRYIPPDATKVQLWWHAVETDFIILRNLSAQCPTQQGDIALLSTLHLIQKVVSRLAYHICPEETGLIDWHLQTFLNHLHVSYQQALKRHHATSCAYHHYAQNELNRLRRELIRIGIVEHVLA